MSDEIDNMLDTLAHHAPDWIARIRTHIHLIECRNTELESIGALTESDKDKRITALQSRNAELEADLEESAKGHMALSADLHKMLAENAKLEAACKDLSDLAHKTHTYCEDGWYSCPMAEDGCANESRGPECDCGAAEHNAKVDAIRRAAGYLKEKGNE